MYSGLLTKQTVFASLRRLTVKQATILASSKHEHAIKISASSILALFKVLIFDPFPAIYIISSLSKAPVLFSSLSMIVMS